MLLNLQEALPTLVETKYVAAKAAQTLIFSPTELTIIRTTTGIPFQLRYCPSLAKKPTPHKDETPQPKIKKFNPFDDPKELLVTSIPASKPSHNLVLNKFPIIAEHSILATKTNKPQTSLLEQDDLEATHACLQAWETEEEENANPQGTKRRLFAFFNSGEYSGASQPHRHLQFLPVESMKQDSQSEGWDLLIDLISSTPETTRDQSSDLIYHKTLPFTHFASPLPSNPTGTQLLNIYHTLYQSATKSVDTFIANEPGKLKLHDTEDGSLPISYNLAMTTTAMAICPRRSEGYMLRRDDGSEIGFVQLNGTLLGGTLMVKYKEEWEALKGQPGKLDEVLEAVGIPTSRASKI